LTIRFSSTLILRGRPHQPRRPYPPPRGERWRERERERAREREREREREGEREREKKRASHPPLLTKIHSRLSGAFDFPELLRTSSLKAQPEQAQVCTHLCASVLVPSFSAHVPFQPSQASAALPPTAPARPALASISPPQSVRSATGLLRRGSSDRAEHSTGASTRSHASAPDSEASAGCPLACRACRRVTMLGQQHGFGFSLRSEVVRTCLLFRQACKCFSVTRVMILFH
jgi:hypothetical protein